MKKAASLFVGMYLITLTLFWIETGSSWKGLLFGIVSATLKTCWSVAHSHFFHCKGKVVDDNLTEETIKVDFRCDNCTNCERNEVQPQKVKHG